MLNKSFDEADKVENTLSMFKSWNAELFLKVLEALYVQVVTSLKSVVCNSL